MTFTLRLCSMFLALSVLPSQADDLLLNISEKARLINSIHGVFTQKRKIFALPLPIESSGNYQYKKNEGVQWRTLYPIESLLLVTSESVLVDGKTSTQPTARKFSQIILSVFSGELDALREQFHVSVKGERTDWRLILVPKTELVAARITCVHISGSVVTERVEIYEANKDVILISLSSESISVLDQ